VGVRAEVIWGWGGGDGIKKMSPLEVSAQYLVDIRNAWNFLMARDNAELRLEREEVLLTVPASFDAAARELTVQAAERAGLPAVRLLEEPQAAFYAWIHVLGEPS